MTISVTFRYAGWMHQLLAYQADSTYNISYTMGRIIGILFIVIVVLVVLKAVFKKR